MTALLLLLALIFATLTTSTVDSFTTTSWSFPTRTPWSSRLQSVVAVPASELERDLSAEEKTVVSVVRNSGPAVAFVTSVLPLSDSAAVNNNSSRRRRQRRGPQNDNDDDDNKPGSIPRGRSLGSGSGFLVDARGYLVTNYHVIEQASRLQNSAAVIDRIQADLAGNLTYYFPNVNGTALLQQLLPLRAPPLPEVYVRIDSATNYQKCRIVDVRPDIDIAVLKIVTADKNGNSTTTTTNNLRTPLQFGSSSNLLVGQGLIAIGNPFGLDNTVTTGVVSALDREIQTGSRTGMQQRPIRNCIQTDCSINPGNSGGPLLNRQGSVVGVNTAILTTSGSSAGIGFAIEADQVEPVVRAMIRHDAATQTTRRMPWLGVTVLTNSNSSVVSGCVVCRVERKSPADEAGIRGLTIFEQDASVQYGDAIVAVGGNAVGTVQELRTELDNRAVGEKVQVTLQNAATKERRVVYLTLQARPVP